jgi:hypothetical protein
MVKWPLENRSAGSRVVVKENKRSVQWWTLKTRSSLKALLALAVLLALESVLIAVWWSRVAKREARMKQPSRALSRLSLAARENSDQQPLRERTYGRATLHGAAGSSVRQVKHETG